MLKSRRSANAIAMARTAAEDQVPRIFPTARRGDDLKFYGIPAATFQQNRPQSDIPPYGRGPCSGLSSVICNIK
jgi:hypothetical protein